jgi:hypothetical protein
MTGTPSPSDAQLLREALDAVDGPINETLEAIGKSVGPVLAAEGEFTKTITTLATGALIVSISIAQLVFPRSTHLRWPLLLFAAWVALGLTIVLAAFRVWWLRDASDYVARIEGARADVHAFVRKRPTQQEMSDYIDTELDRAYTEAAGAAMSNHKKLDRSMKASAWIFAAAMGMLITFAIANASSRTPDYGPRLLPDSVSVK